MFGIPRLYAMLGAGVVIALFLAWVWRVDSLRAKHLKEVQAAELKLTISNTSLKACTGHIEDNNRRITEAAARLDQAKQQAAADVARANARWEAQKGRVASLEASARDNSQPACKVSGAALRALEGL